MDESLVTAQNIADRAHQLNGAEERRAYLNRVCGDNAELRQRVEMLLTGNEPSSSCADAPLPTLDTNDIDRGQCLDPNAPSVPPLEGVGSLIGPYKLLQQIGAGGMGIVFMAEQQEPVKRKVAVKVIKAGMDSAQVVARFEAERQALALMDHPHIAKVLDAGTTQSGRPYFVMELVKGIPVTKYCDEQRLTLKQRLELFVPVCQAIQHAHQKGIIHRDIKPGNVLIAAYDGKPAPKVIDFGVAKATGQKLTDRTLFTGFGGIVGTLEYMSPEQAEFNALDIDTRSDIYSLGVLLYELLTGTTPLTRQRLKGAELTEVLRLIREEEPPRPSTRLNESRDGLASVSAQRQIEPVGLLKAVRGEVDWIVMKALEKDRTRRYDTANNLARDIQRYLADEPVEAGPPSAAYRLRKLAWKHRRSLATAAALLLLLVAGVVVSTSLAVWAMRAERRAVDERNRALAAEAEATQQRDKAVGAGQATKRSEEDTKAVLDYFQNKVLSAGRPKDQAGGQGKDVTLRQAVDKAAEDIAESFQDRPVVEASIRNTLGMTYWYLGEYSLAVEQLELALALRQTNLGPDDSDTLFSRNNLAAAYQAAGRTEDAIRLHEQTLQLYETKLGADHPDTLISRNNLAYSYQAAGRTADAIRLHQQNLKRREAKLGPSHPDTLLSRNNLAHSYQAAGRTVEAVRLYEQTLKLYEANFGAGHPDTFHSRNNLADLYRTVGRTAEAIRLHQRNLKLREDKLGPDHPDTLGSRDNLAAAYQAAGRTADALRLHEQTLTQREDKLGPDHPDTLSSRNNLAEAYRAASRTADAIRLHQQNLQLREAKLGLDHPDTLISRNNLANAYQATGHIDDAIHLYEQNLKQLERKHALDHPDTLLFRNNLAEAYRAAGRTGDALRLHEQTLKQRETKLGPDHPDTVVSRNNLATLYDQTGQFAKAEPLFRAVLDQTRKRYGADHTATAARMATLGLNLLHQHKYTNAEPLLRDSLKVRQAKQPDTWTTFNVQSLLGGALLGQKKYNDAEPLLVQGYQGMKERQAKIPLRVKVRLSEALERLVHLYEGTGDKIQADKWRKELDDAKK